MTTQYIVILLAFIVPALAMRQYREETAAAPEPHPHGVRCRDSALPECYWCADCQPQPETVTTAYGTMTAERYARACERAHTYRGDNEEPLYAVGSDYPVAWVSPSERITPVAGLAGAVRRPS